MASRKMIRLDGSGGRGTSTHAVGDWIRLNWEDPDDRAWIEGESGLDELVAEGLLAEDTRPRVVEHKNGVLIILRGVNRNAGERPEDMISLRIWFDGRRLISASRSRLRTVEALTRALAEDRGPHDLPDLLLDLITGLTEQTDDLIETIEEALDAIEGELLEGADRDLRERIGQIRRSVIVIRRYLAPERDALARLANLSSPLLERLDRGRVREQADGLTRLVEDLDMARERGAMLHEQLLGRLSDQLNTRMYLLSIVAAIFLPLGFLTGLFGINVGGMPWVEAAMGFWWVVLLSLAIGMGLGWWLKRRRWF
ncbi:MAG: zinc transporter ZntB [Pseudomonadota bacterium]